MSFGDETGDFTSIYAELRSIDSKKLDNTLHIELDNGNSNPKVASEKQHKELPVYATVNIEKKHEARNQQANKDPNNDYGIYEDIEFYNQNTKLEESAIYEMVKNSLNIFLLTL
jgi:hypothetical protein